jgi:tetratricopeptide (TPR) repeat protein
LEVFEDHGKDSYGALVSHTEQIHKAVQLAANNKEDEAYGIFASLLGKNFDDFQALYGLARLYMQSENYGIAYNLYRLCASFKKLGPGPWNGMGLCHAETWDLDAAAHLFKKALSFDENDKHALGNLSLISLLKCEPEKALGFAALALKQDPDFEEVIHHRTYAQLMLGRWKEGWEGHRRILGKVKTRAERFYENHGRMLPRWDGTPGQSILVYGEQGIGDEISFASCISDLRAVSKQVVFDCDHRLESLFRRSFEGLHVHGTRFKNPMEWVDNYHFDARVAIGDLPSFFRNDEFPGTPYLKAEPMQIAGSPRIGIAWTGGLPNTGSAKRSLSLDALLPIFESVPATWVSLQYKDCAAEVAEFQRKHGIEILQPAEARSKDYSETASLVQGLDLVITVTTAAVHLSGALGKEAWVLVPKNPRWFYGINVDRTPWYKSVQYFRETKDWSEPISQIVKLLRLRYS